MYKMEAEPGDQINRFLRSASEISWARGETVIATFNGIEIEVHGDSRNEDLAMIYHLKCELVRVPA